MLILSSLTACNMNATEEEAVSVGEQATLAGSAWWVEDIAGRGVIDNSHTTIEFTADGRVSGDTGCNRYSGGVEVDGTTIKFGLMAGTLKACNEALMDQEMKFYQAVDKVVSWEIAETGLLHLRGDDARDQIRAFRIEE